MSAAQMIYGAALQKLNHRMEHFKVYSGKCDDSSDEHC